MDLGSGPGTLSKVVQAAGGEAVLLDVSVAMLRAAPFRDRVAGAFEHLPFREGVFDAVVSGFAVRDALDLRRALGQIRRVLRKGGKFAFCDLGKPASAVKALAIAVYLGTIPSVIGLVTAGRSGLKYRSLFDTYLLVLNNRQMKAALSSGFREVSIHETQLGGSIVAKCVL